MKHVDRHRRGDPAARRGGAGLPEVQPARGAQARAGRPGRAGRRGRRRWSSRRRRRGRAGGVECPPDLPRISGDRPVLRQALLNLALNAVQAMPQGGDAAVPRPRGARTAGWRSTVEDTGRGHPARAPVAYFRPLFHDEGAGQRHRAVDGLSRDSASRRRHRGTIDAWCVGRRSTLCLPRRTTGDLLPRRRHDLRASRAWALVRCPGPRGAGVVLPRAADAFVAAPPSRRRSPCRPLPPRLVGPVVVERRRRAPVAQTPPPRRQPSPPPRTPRPRPAGQAAARGEASRRAAGASACGAAASPASRRPPAPHPETADDAEAIRRVRETLPRAARKLSKVEPRWPVTAARDSNHNGHTLHRPVRGTRSGQDEARLCALLAEKADTLSSRLGQALSGATRAPLPTRERPARLRPNPARRDPELLLLRDSDHLLCLRRDDETLVVPACDKSVTPAHSSAAQNRRSRCSTTLPSVICTHRLSKGLVPDLVLYVRQLQRVPCHLRVGRPARARADVGTERRHANGTIAAGRDVEDRGTPGP